MKRFFIILSILVVGLWLVYLSGEKPEPPQLKTYTFALPDSLTTLAQQIQTEEKAVVGIRPDNEARIIFADSLHPSKTKVAILYIHGFSASQEEGDPIHTHLAQRYHANLYLARLAHHGTNLGDSTMQNSKSDDFIASAEKALAIAQKLGDEVIVVGTSFGGALTLYLAAHHPEIKAIALYSPCIKIFDDKAELIDNHWGKTLSRFVLGSDVRDFKPYNALHAKYWCTHYHVDGIVALQNFLTHLMTPETFAQVKCPTFVGYYYKNETEQDKVVSVKAILEMYENLGVNASQKKLVNFPNAGNHVIGSYVLSKDYQHVEKETAQFLDALVK